VNLEIQPKRLFVCGVLTVVSETHRNFGIVFRMLSVNIEADTRKLYMNGLVVQLCLEGNAFLFYLTL
jgi:hypothetical protein